jgi:serine/threonine protein kinase
MFVSMYESSWSRETEIYQTCMLRHDNILGFIASDILGYGSTINLVLITEYHPLGSLCDYLQNNTIDEQILLKFSYSIINGLNHLHQEIFSTSYKPSIVHRDIKTKNILIKNSLECCIGDFGMAIKYDIRFNRMSYSDDAALNSNKKREGSVRYMAPECLDDTLNYESIESLKKCDIYAYSLVLWELLNRLDLNSMNNGMNKHHQPPFHEYVDGEPTIDMMKDIVCIKSIRPALAFENVHLFQKVRLQFLNSN